MHREHHDENEKGGLRSSYWIGLILAPILAMLAYVFLPSESLNESGEVVRGLSHNGRAVVAIAVLMATLWVTEALPLAVTALLPIIMFPLFTGGVISVRSVTTAYGHDLIYLYLGGFMIAMAMQRWGLHRRIALHTVLFFGTQPARLVAGFMVATAFLSMWVSNTATTVMMMPIAMSVVELVRRELIKSNDPNFNPDHKHFNFAICLMLGIAYAASIGGIGTLIGTGTIALPLVVTFLPITWLLLTKVIFPIRIRHIPGGRELIHNELKSQGPISRAELMVLIIFSTTGLLWMVRPLLTGLQMPGGWQPLAGLSDAGISLTAAVTLFCLPVDRKHGRFLLTWQQAVKLPWGIIILLGGGLALAYAIKTTGVAEFIGCTVSDLKGLPLVVLIMMVCATVIFVTELSSNVATVSAFGPILAAVAVGLGISPLLLIIPTAIAASCAFMMPVATPPNAIVFSSGEITIPQMCKAGLFLNIVGIALVTLLIYFVAIPLLSIKI